MKFHLAIAMMLFAASTLSFAQDAPVDYAKLLKDKQAKAAKHHPTKSHKTVRKAVTHRRTKRLGNGQHSLNVATRPVGPSKADLRQKLAYATAKKARQTEFNKDVAQAQSQLEKGDLGGAKTTIDHANSLIADGPGLTDLRQKVADATAKKAQRLSAPAYQEGMDLYLGRNGKIRDYDAAYARLKQAADLGNPDAMLALADALELGRGVDQPDKAQAAALRSRAVGVYGELASTGNAEAVGKWFKSVGSTMEFRRVLKQLANAGDTNSMLRLWQIYLKGDGLPQSDPEQAAVWFTKAQKSSPPTDPELLEQLGNTLTFGLDGQKDLELGKKFLVQASDLLSTTDPKHSSELKELASTGHKTNPITGQEMLYIPAGWFVMGEDQQSNNKPHRVYLDGYWLSKNLVTVGDFRKFKDATGYSYDFNSNRPDFGWQDDHPMVNVTWDDAVAYCHWAHGELPTEAQFEKAARGPEGFAYPWGNTWDSSKCSNSVDTKQSGTSAVGSYPAGVSPYGLLDMAGNVWEMCLDWYQADYSNLPDHNPAGPSNGRQYRVLRGGSWRNDNSDFFGSAFRTFNVPPYRVTRIGFRLSGQ